jgi:hypothetical protein
MTIPRRARALIAFSALAVIACDEAPKTTVTFRVDDPWQYVQAVLPNGPLLVEIRGRPTDDSRDVIEGAVLSAFKEAVTWNARASFTADGTEAGSRSIRVVMTFHGGAGPSGREQCAGKSEGAGPLADVAIAVVATLCSGDDVLANVEGRLAKSNGLQDRKSGALLRQIALELFDRTRSA